MLDDPHPVTQHHIPQEWNPKYDSMFSAVLTKLHSMSYTAAQCECGNISCVQVFVFIIFVTYCPQSFTSLVVHCYMYLLT